MTGHLADAPRAAITAARGVGHPLSPWIEAQEESTCWGCGEDIHPGQPICSDGRDGWLCCFCGTPRRPIHDVPTRGLL